jgi:hypothetical protein
MTSMRANDSFTSGSFSRIYSLGSDEKEVATKFLIRKNAQQQQRVIITKSTIKFF